MSLFKPAILVVDDDFVDQEIVKRGVAKINLEVDVHSAIDGSAALQMLRSDQFTSAQHENLVVFLDINMPGMNGHQFLDEIRRDEHLRRTIVFVLTTSDHPRDVLRAHDRNVAGYFVKSNVDALLETVSVYINNAKFPPLRVAPCNIDVGVPSSLVNDSTSIG